MHQDILPHPEQIVTLSFQQNQEYLLEQWEHGFKCWLKILDPQSLRRVCLDYRLLEADGSVSKKMLAFLALANDMRIMTDDPLKITLSLKTTEQSRQTRQDLEFLLAAIPESIRLIAGRFPKLQYLALEGMRHIPGFDDFLKQEIDHVGLSYVIGVWRLAAADTLPFVMRLALAETMMHNTRIDTLESLFDLPCAKGLLKGLYKLKPEALSRENIWNLFDLTARHEKSRAICMCPALTTESLPELLQVPNWMVTPGLFQILSAELDENQSLSSIIPPSILNAPYDIRLPIKKSFSKAKNLAELERRVFNWADRLYDQANFPEPPIKASEFLEPIRTGLALRREGRKMRNCVVGYAEQVLRGDFYFYH